MATDFPPFTLHVRSISAFRGYRRLYDDVSFALRSGEAIELRGPNGAGKTTLLRILAGLTQPASGEIAFDLGGSLADMGSHAHFLGHLDAVKAGESAAAQARFWAQYFDAPLSAADAALSRVGLEKRQNVPGRGLSAGQKRRLALARLVMAPRPVWLLDEPFASLDIQGRELVLDLVEAHRAAGGAAIVALHGEGLPNAQTLDVSSPSVGNVEPA
ncbi:MAG: heme ABC exporter ATP-binding protein CcmA [Pseudomonadota bacterium]